MKASIKDINGGIVDVDSVEDFCLIEYSGESGTSKKYVFLKFSGNQFCVVYSEYPAINVGDLLSRQRIQADRTGYRLFKGVLSLSN